jgi:hypothetical protein
MQAVKDAGESCILSAMPTLLKRGLALTLPVCLLWLFVACVAVCSLHAEKEGFAESESSCSERSLVSSESEECCSVSAGERSVITERITFAWISPKAVRAISLSTDLISRTSQMHRPDRYSLPGPNVKLLGTLRI